ncbi:MAG: AraC family transcriptional regulator [Oscillospiraceae bacterium]|nr:AraC family transcriptional regulator [Oscillospiraceae bacterium]
MRNFYDYTDKYITFHYSKTDFPDQKSTGFSAHTHLLNELYYFISGKAVFKIEGTRYPLHPGDILIMRHAESHSLEISSGEPYERLSLHFDSELLRSIDPELHLLHAYNDRELGTNNLFTPSDFYTPICGMLAEALLKKTDNPRQHIISMLIPILSELSVAYENKKNNPSENDDSGRRIIDYINRHLSDDLSLDHICARFYISKPQLCRIFKAATGSTVWEYVTVKRLMAAQQLIRSGTAPTKAAANCGFNDYSVFYRAYRRRFGSSPSAR